MRISLEQSHLVFYEIAMAIGGSLHMRTMLRHCIPVYLKKLNCSVAGVFQLSETQDSFTYDPIFSVPRNTTDHPVFHAVRRSIARSFSYDELTTFCASLPLSGQTSDNEYYHMMVLPGFGLLYLGRRNEPLDPYIIKSLAPLNNKLASAGRTCLQNEALQRSEEKFRGIFENAAIGIFQCTLHGELLHANPAYARLFGRTRPDELIGRALDRDPFVRPQDADALLRMFKTQSKIKDFRTQLRQPDGAATWILVNSRIQQDCTGSYAFHEGTAEDITDTVQHEQMRLAKEAAESANRAKSQFLANMSHELRTPMNSILGFCDILLEEPLEAHQTEYLHIINQAAQNLLALINGLLDYSKIEAGKMDLETVPCTLEEILKNISDLMSPKAVEKGIVFEVKRCEPLPEIFYSDPLRVQQCLLNLVSNAVKFTPDGHVHLTVSTEKGRQSDWLRFEVTDTGIGIAHDKQKDIFESFTQVDNSMARKFGGTGLGLSITLQLVKLLGGKIALQSDYGHGSTFTIDLPLFIDEHAVAEHTWQPAL